MKMVAAARDIDIQALSDNINLLAKLSITQIANHITMKIRTFFLVTLMLGSGIARADVQPETTCYMYDS
jgi:uncharacterized protein (DUF2345 family)